MANVVNIGLALTYYDKIIISFLDYYATKEEKIYSGWILVMAVLMNVVHWCCWNMGFFFIKDDVLPPNYLQEEIEGNIANKAQIVPQDSREEDERGEEVKSMVIISRTIIWMS